MKFNRKILCGVLIVFIVMSTTIIPATAYDLLGEYNDPTSPFNPLSPYSPYNQAGYDHDRDEDTDSVIDTPDIYEIVETPDIYEVVETPNSNGKNSDSPVILVIIIIVIIMDVALLVIGCIDACSNIC